MRLFRRKRAEAEKADKSVKSVIATLPARAWAGVRRARSWLRNPVVAAVLAAPLGFALLIAVGFVLTQRSAPSGVAVDLAPTETGVLRQGASASRGPGYADRDLDGALTISPVAAEGFANLVPLAPDKPLRPAPDPALLDSSRSSRLPQIAADGRMPRKVYARPFDARDDRMRLVLIVSGVGLSRAASEAAIDRLPADVTLALDAYATEPEAWSSRARQAGHEVLATLPLEGQDFPLSDPGPRGMLSTLKPAELIRRADLILSAFTGYVGVLAVGSSRLADTPTSLETVLDVLAQRGLLLVEGTPNGELPFLGQSGAHRSLARLRLDVVLPDDPTTAMVDAAFGQLEAIAREHLIGAGLIRPSPLAFERLRDWLSKLDRQRFVLAPVSAVVLTGGSS